MYIYCKCTTVANRPIIYPTAVSDVTHSIPSELWNISRICDISAFSTLIPTFIQLINTCLVIRQWDCFNVEFLSERPHHPHFYKHTTVAYKTATVCNEV